MLILSPIIILIKNIFVLRIFTIMIGQILKLFRKLLCMFVILLMTSHHVLPSPLITNSTLHKRQTPLDESENSRNVFTVDDPNEMGNGKIRHKRQECQGGFECDDDQWCYNNMCEYPCPKLACERVHPPDGRCIVRDHQPVCVTAEGLTEQELLKKNGGCTFSSDCGANEWCHNDKCEDPCLKMNCGAIYDNGKCSVENYQPVCKPSDEIINPDDSGSNREKAKMDDLVLKLENFVIVIPLAGMLFLYCFYAQQLLNEGEKFRTTLWESNFIDKPKWFKSSMLIIMIRIAKELEIKPFGFYVLNLRTFSMVMKAAYSYYSMLNSLKKRI
ncbi:uncharacterized protein LOC111049996 isoform X4 [Nilaparvata lugens]|uniref:uncharacterized protein LOC111049996 isoform X4 n=1 Tax=Nilaparvata lugens TaxID=108931 RepID=UPI00193DF9A3|nr:uncharacterized protein LOC111049996 isoform X4 [Nilaparvata lugens]